MSLTATIKAVLEATQTRAIDLATANSPLSNSKLFSFTDGVGANQCNLIFSDTRTLAASANEDLDLAGSLTDIYGQTVAFARIKALLIKAAAGNTNNLNVSRPASNGVPLFLAASDGLVLKPNGFFLWVDPTAAGVVVTAGTGDLLNIANAAGTTGVDYDIIILGGAT